MLEQIRVKNFALIEEAALEFHPRLNIITGETGAGKTILIDALSAVLGDRLDLTSLRLKDQSCVVEAVFDLRKSKLAKRADISEWLSDDDECLVFRREITSDGRNKCSINGRTANVSNLKTIGKFLADFHGQHDHQLLLDPASHLVILDRLAGAPPKASLASGGENLKEAYGNVFGEYAEAKRKLAELVSLEQGRERELDLLKYQVDEIERVKPQVGEDTQLKEEHVRLAHAGKLSERSAELLDRMSDGERSVADQIGQCAKLLGEMVRIDDSLKTLSNQMNELEVLAGELTRAVRDYQDKVTFDPDRLKEVEERLEAIDMIKRKYGGSVEEALAFLKKAKERYELLAHAGERSKELEQKIKEYEANVASEGKKLTAARKRSASELKSAIERELKALGIPHARFECRVEASEPAESGCDHVEFYISPNLGEELVALARIISGGEASRIMLALKRVLIDTDEIPTMIFDEIDANIGGRIGDVVGEKLSQIAKKHQVLLVTHLPQIASFADRHFKVTKAVEGKRTRTRYEPIEGEVRVRELAEMMAGEKKSDVATKHAREMLAAQQK